MTIPYYRPRRLRRNETIRRMVRETTLFVNDFIYPFFVIEGKDILIIFSSIAGYYQ